MVACANCNIPFLKKSGNKGFYRFSLENSLPSGGVAREALAEMTGSEFSAVPSKRNGQFLCPSCWSNLNDVVKYRVAVNEFWSKTDDATYIGCKRKCDCEEIVQATLKKPRCSPHKKGKKRHKKMLFPPKAVIGTRWESISTAVKARQYGRAIRGLYQATKGSKRKFIEIVAKIVRKEVACVLALPDFPLCGEATIPNIADFSWDKTIGSLEEHAPLLCMTLKTVVSRQPKIRDPSLDDASIPADVKPKLGTALACMLHAKNPRKARLLQTVMSVQLWRDGLKVDTIKELSRTGFCLSYPATLTAVDKLQITSNSDTGASAGQQPTEDCSAEMPQAQEDPELAAAVATIASDTDGEVTALPDAEDEVNALSDAEDEVNSLSDAEDEVNSLSDAEDEVNLLSDAEDEVTALPDAEDEVNSLSDAEDEVTALSDAEDETVLYQDHDDTGDSETETTQELMEDGNWYDDIESTEQLCQMFNINVVQEMDKETPG